MASTSLDPGRRTHGDGSETPEWECQPTTYRFGGTDMPDGERVRVDFESTHVAIALQGFVLTVRGTTRRPMPVAIEEAAGIPANEWWVLEVVGYDPGIGPEVITPYTANLAFEGLPTGVRGILLLGATKEVRIGSGELMTSGT